MDEFELQDDQYQEDETGAVVPGNPDDLSDDDMAASLGFMTTLSAQAMGGPAEVEESNEPTPDEEQAEMDEQGPMEPANEPEEKKEPAEGDNALTAIQSDLALIKEALGLKE